MPNPRKLPTAAEVYPILQAELPILATVTLADFISIFTRLRRTSEMHSKGSATSPVLAAQLYELLEDKGRGQAYDLAEEDAQNLWFVKSGATKKSRQNDVRKMIVEINPWVKFDLARDLEILTASVFIKNLNKFSEPEKSTSAVSQQICDTFV